VAVNAAGDAGAGRLWIKATAPWSAIYQAGKSTFTYVSDLPAHAADDAVAALAAAGRPVSQVGLDHGVAADSGPETRGSGDELADESVVERLERGLRRLALHLDKMTGHLAR
jgi:hypothetical protein